MANKDAPKKSAKKTRKSTSKKAKVEEVLQDRVHATVGRGVLAYFSSEGEPPSGGNHPPPEEVKDVAPEEAETDLGAMLDEEVRAAGDAHEEIAVSRDGKAVEAPEAAEVPTPRATETAETAAEVTPRPPVEAARPEASPAEELPTAAAPDVTAATVDVTPPRLRPAGTLLEHPMEVEVTPPGPGGEPSEGIPEPTTPSATLPREEIIRRISEDHFRDLEEEISRLYDIVPQALASDEEAANEALVALHEARGLLWMAPERLVDAEYQVNQVKTLIERHRLSAEWGRVYGRRLLAYEVVWLFGLLAGFVALQLGQTTIIGWVESIVGANADRTFTGVLIPFLNSLVWGGIGGVVGALYSLWWHVSEKQDFDKRYNMWYLVQPVMGFVLGGIVYLIIATGFLALQGTPPTAEAARGVQMFPSLVAVLGGFRQKFVYELLERIIRVLTPTPGA